MSINHYRFGSVQSRFTTGSPSRPPEPEPLNSPQVPNPTEPTPEPRFGSGFKPVLCGSEPDCGNTTPQPCFRHCSFWSGVLPMQQPISPCMLIPVVSEFDSLPFFCFILSCCTHYPTWRMLSVLAVHWRGITFISACSHLHISHQMALDLQGLLSNILNVAWNNPWPERHEKKHKGLQV